MKKKKPTKETEEIPPHILRFRKIYGRYQRNYTIIVCLGIAAIVAIWYFTNHFWGATTLAFGLWSWAFYEDGAQENCIDEWEYAYPKDGFRRMVNSWPWFVCFAFIAYICCNRWMPWLF